MDRDEWYDAGTQAGPRLVMWWIEAGHLPTIEEAALRLASLARQGATADAFDWAYLRAKG